MKQTSTEEGQEVRKKDGNQRKNQKSEEESKLSRPQHY